MTIRPAVSSDIDVMSTLIGRYAAEGIMLPRSKAGLLASLTEYWVADISGMIIGCGGLQPYNSISGEIYGLATISDQAPRGTGKAIVQALLDEARGKNLLQVFALTLVPVFFEKMGFHRVEHRDLPLKVWKDCVACPKFGNCDEIAMVLDLENAH